MQWTMSSTTFLQETQELTLFYNKVWKFIISKKWHYNSFKGENNSCWDNSWGRRIQCGLWRPQRNRNIVLFNRGKVIWRSLGQLGMSRWTHLRAEVRTEMRKSKNYKTGAMLCEQVISCHLSPPPAAAAAKSLQSCPTPCDPIDGSPPGSPVLGILQARTLEWVAISFSIARKWSCSVATDSQRPHGLQPTRFLRPWGFPGKSTGVGCHCLLRCMLCIWYIVSNSCLQDT